jgi:hypothetical protein
LTGRWLALWIGITLPLMGGVGAIYRVVATAPTAFAYFHAAIDFVVVGFCVALLFGEEA